MIKHRIQLSRVVRSSQGRQEGFIDIGLKADGSWISIPVITVEGRREGPCILVDACTHGDEYEGAEAIIRISRSLDPEELSGTFVGVPALNFEAFGSMQRISPIDDINLNRIFPGNPHTYITQRIAHAYTERLQSEADFIISFHGGGTVLHLEPLVGYQPQDDEVGRKTRRMAEVFGTKVIWKMQNLPFDGVSSVEAKKRGIPAILPEIGSHCSRLTDRGKHIELCEQGIRNVMVELDMIGGEKGNSRNPIDIELQYLHTDNGGIHILEKGVMEKAKRGEVLATVTDVFGEPVSRVEAPFDGLVLGFWSFPVIRPGDWSYLYGKVL